MLPEQPNSDDKLIAEIEQALQEAEAGDFADDTEVVSRFRQYSMEG